MTDARKQLIFDLLSELCTPLEAENSTILSRLFIAGNMTREQRNAYTEWFLQQPEEAECRAAAALLKNSQTIDSARENAARMQQAELALFRRIREWCEKGGAA